jgi:hypothetical protein
VIRATAELAELALQASKHQLPELWAQLTEVSTGEEEIRIVCARAMLQVLTILHPVPGGNEM